MTTPNFTPRPWAAERIAFVIGAYEVSPDDFYSSLKPPNVVECRSAATYLLYEFYGPGCQQMTMNEAGWHFGRTHSRIIDGLGWMRRNPTALARADALAARMGLRKIGRSK